MAELWTGPKVARFREPSSTDFDGAAISIFRQLVFAHTDAATSEETIVCYAIGIVNNAVDNSS